MSNVFPVMIAPRWKQAFVAAAIVPNLLCGTLGSGGAKPFQPGDPALPASRSYPVSLRTWNGQVNLGLIGKDVMFGGPGRPLSNFDWQLPRAVRAAIRDVQGAPFALLNSGTPPPLPFANYDWQLPRTAYRFDGSWQTTVVVIPTPPFTPAQSQLPRVSDRFDRSWSSNLLETTLAPSVATAPFVQADWQLPRSAAYSTILRTWLQGVPINLFGQDTMFGAAGQPLENADWPLWRATRRAIGEGVAPPLTLLTIIPPTPFLSVDGRLPSSAVYPISLRTWNAAPSLLGQDTFFGGPGQPPTNANPLPARAPAPGQSWSVNLLETTLAQVSAPFGSTDWRLPAQAARSGQVWTQNLLLSTLFVPPSMPLNLFDARLPVLRPRGAQNWLGQALNFTPPPIVSPLTKVNPERLIEAPGNGRLIVTFNGSRLLLSTNARGRLIS